MKCMNNLHVKPFPCRTRACLPGPAGAVICLVLCLWASMALGASPFTVAKPFGPSGTCLDPSKGGNGWYACEAGITETLFVLDFDMKLNPLAGPGVQESLSTDLGDPSPG